MHVLAIENKPFAGDQPPKFLITWTTSEIDLIDQFSLIYLSPLGEGPTEQSIPLNELDNWTKRFRILSYAGVSERVAR